MILSNFMLINMLIAMMASTYEQVRENSETYFMAGKARHTFRWSNYPAAFPPFNLLSLPYVLVFYPLKSALWCAYCLKDIADSHTDPAEWSVNHGVNSIAAKVAGLADGGADKPVRPNPFLPVLPVLPPVAPPPLSISGWAPPSSAPLATWLTAPTLPRGR